VPALALPGVGNEADAVGPWARGTAVIVALDQDEPGRESAIRLARAVVAAGGRPVRLRWPSGTKDACDVLQELGHVAMADFLARAVREVTS